jgi:hypothetical protein
MAAPARVASDSSRVHVADYVAGYADTLVATGSNVRRRPAEAACTVSAVEAARGQARNATCTKCHACL